MRGLNKISTAYLVGMQLYFGENKGFKYLLTVIYVFSKFAYATLTKSKSVEDKTAAMKTVLDHGRVPKKLQVDQGSGL